MVEISLTTFVDFVIKSGTTRITYVSRAKRLYEQGYEPAFDFWKPLREAIIRVHKENLPKKELDKVLTTVSDPNKLRIYPQRIDSYNRWMGRKSIEWFDVSTKSWESGKLTVRVNPELGLKIDAVNHIVKLYFKENKLSKQRVDLLLFLLKFTFSDTFPNATPGIIDVARGKLITPTKVIPNIEALLEAEAAAFVKLWESL